MNTERPSFEPRTPQEHPVVGIPESFWEKLKAEKPDALHWDRIDAAMSVLRGESVAVDPSQMHKAAESSLGLTSQDPEPIKSQKFWRMVFETENSPYSKKERKIEWGSAKEAFDEMKHDFPSFIKNYSDHIRAIDVDLRGGRDPGEAKERLQRVAALSGIMALWIAFDAGTSYPIKKVMHKYFPLHGDNSHRDASIQFFGKLIEVMNDKLASAWGGDLADHLAGKRVAFPTEPPDKLADVLTVAFPQPFEDYVNGSVLESLFRIIYQVPIYGALFEQGMTRIARLQGKSGQNKGIGKAMYMAFARYLWVRRFGPKEKSSIRPDQPFNFSVGAKTPIID